MYLCAENPTVPKKITNTLTLNALKTLHISIYPKLLYRLYFLATINYLKPLLLKIYISAIILTLNLYNVSIYSKKGFL